MVGFPTYDVHQIRVETELGRPIPAITDHRLVRVKPIASITSGDTFLMTVA